MTQTERKILLQDMVTTQKQIQSMQKRLNNDPSLLKNESFQEQRSKLFYKSYCIDCTLHEKWAVRYETYVKGI